MCPLGEFCKYVLGVHSKASNIACVGELGRFPIYVDFCNNMLKYYFMSEKRRLLSWCQTLLVSKKLHQSGDKSWFSGVNTILKEINVDETNCNQTTFLLKKYV